MFKEAARRKLRFSTVKGLISVEDLYDIPLTSRDRFNLNDIAKNVYSSIKESIEVDFVSKTTSVDSDDELKLNILKDIIKDKQDEIKAKTELAVNKSHNELIDRLIQEKELENLKGMSIDDLKALRK